MSKDKTLAIIICIVGLIITITAISVNTLISENTNQMEIELNRSIYNKNPSGYAAWYKVISMSNIHPSIVEDSFSKLDNDEISFNTMLVTSPKSSNSESYVFSKDEYSHLLNWVRQGNTLIFVDNFTNYNSAYFLKDELKINYKVINNNKKEDNNENQDFVETESEVYSKEKFIIPVNIKNSSLSYLTKEISSSSKVRLKSNNIEPILSDKNGIVLGKRKYGMGQIYILTLPDIVDNDSLYENEDNYQFLTNLVSINGKNFGINEYVHGNGKSETATDYLAATILNPIFKQLLLFTVVLIWSVSRRFGKPKEIEDKKRNTNLEYVDAIANIYNSANLTGSALKTIFNDFTHKLTKDLKVNPNIAQEDLLEIINQSFPSHEAKEIKEIYLKVKKNIESNNISKKDMLDLCKKMNIYRLKGNKYATKC